jgi:hypothetical protein
MLKEYNINKIYDAFAVLIIARYWELTYLEDGTIFYDPISDAPLIVVIEANSGSWQPVGSMTTAATSFQTNYWSQIV